MNALRSYLADFIALIFPQLCPACHASLMANEDLLCTECLYSLPFTNFHLQPDNIVAQQFWGKLAVEAAYTLYYFNKGGKVQNLVHQLKYNGQPRIGNLLGNMAGDQLKQNTVFATADVIIPVPLHKSRLKQRGYNQSACFADGLAQQLNATVEIDNLVRITDTKTQTHKSRFARFQNMQEVFTVLHPERLTNKHILLVDDVITTGATLEACAQVLLDGGAGKLSIAALAFAE